MSGLPRRFVPLLGSLLVLIVPHPAGADATSEALLWQHGTAFVAAMNAQDAPTLEAFVRDHLEHAVANEGRTDSFVSMMHADYAEFGAVEKHNVQVLGDGKLVFVFCKRARDTALPYEPEVEAGAVKLGSYIPVTLGARGTSAGGASSTADDLLRFATALQNGTLLDRRHLELMLQPHVPYGSPDTWYGYGTILEKRRGTLAFGHGGTARGTQVEFKIFPERDIVMLVLSNYNTLAAHEMASALDDIIRNGE